MSKHKKNKNKNARQAASAGIKTVYPQADNMEAPEDSDQQVMDAEQDDVAEAEDYEASVEEEAYEEADSADADVAGDSDAAEEANAAGDADAAADITDEAQQAEESADADDAGLMQEEAVPADTDFAENADAAADTDAATYAQEPAEAEASEDPESTQKIVVPEPAAVAEEIELNDDGEGAKASGKKASSKEKSGDEKVNVIRHDEEKKYKVNRNNLKAQTESERARREARRRRRIRQQVLAYVFLLFVVLVVGFGVFLGVKRIVKVSADKKAAAEAEALAEQQRVEEEQAALEAEAVASAEPEYTIEDLGATPTEQLDESIRHTIDQMTLEEKVQGIMFVTPESLTGVDRVLIAGDGTAKALAEFCPGGIIYSAKNVNSSEQFIQMLSNTPSMTKYPVFYCTSETGLNESGLVGSGLISGSMSPKDAAATGNIETVLSVGSSIGTALAGAGITVDLAPVCDLDVVPGGTGSGSTYGNDASVITPYVTGFAEGLSESGIIPAYRYFPSLAASSQNPAAGRAVSERSIDDFRSQEFQVWLSAINAGAGMIQMSNVIYPSIDSDMLPSSLSEKTVTGVLRDELKYNGVILSGPLNDAAITEYYTSGDCAVMALKAGCDVICCPSDPKAACAGIVEAVSSGVVSEERINDALIRLYRIRYADKYDELRSQYEAKAALMGVDLTGVSY